jgi:chorismate--pyruvate lyase
LNRLPDTRTSEPRWRAARGAARAAIPAKFRPWLLDEASLTQRLQACCDAGFRIERIAQGWMRPLPGEARALGMRPGTAALVREVRLLCGNVPWVVARTVIPRATLTGRHRRLARLGNRSLGAVLFADPSMKRGALEIARLERGEALHALVTRGLAKAPGELWGRRSQFRLAGKPLLVCEFFLPAIPEFTC